MVVTCSCPVKHKPDTLSGTRNRGAYAAVNWLDLGALEALKSFRKVGTKCNKITLN